MILILGYDEWDTETHEVQMWIRKLGGVSCRLNSQDLYRASHGSALSIQADSIEIFQEKHAIPIDQINVVWLRRWGPPSPLIIEEFGLINHLVLNNFLENEWRTISEYLFYKLSNKFWLTGASCLHPNKLIISEMARKAGLNVPFHLMTNSVTAIDRFVNSTSTISKVAANFPYLHFGSQVASVFTEAVSAADVSATTETIFPSLFQQRIHKLYEIRVFYLDGEFFSTAIIPTCEEAMLDIKLGVKAGKIENRYQRYCLNNDTKAHIDCLMRMIGCNCGSVDLVRGTDLKYYFLEVNPIGKFSFYSHYCNHGIERRIASYLISKDNE